MAPNTLCIKAPAVKEKAILKSSKPLIMNKNKLRVEEEKIIFSRMINRDQQRRRRHKNVVVPTTPPVVLKAVGDDSTYSKRAYGRSTKFAVSGVVDGDVDGIRWCKVAVDDMGAAKHSLRSGMVLSTIWYEVCQLRYAVCQLIIARGLRSAHLRELPIGLVEKLPRPRLLVWRGINETTTDGVLQRMAILADSSSLTRLRPSAQGREFRQMSPRCRENGIGIDIIIKKVALEAESRIRIRTEHENATRVDTRIKDTIGIEIKNSTRTRIGNENDVGIEERPGGYARQVFAGPWTLDGHFVFRWPESFAFFALG
ncbi:hypothetical protein EVAR_51884_1 [Eumeta japonica]|uniref:Uncharacterized protein n=1 Tax=Eumeta variegata TaxID=151549 RepID=A0A4C1YLP7_EUMVA|nr:hypothetical protein EVAR_51884_1 [Eumeta japonica]